MKVLLAINHPQLVDQFYRESNLEITPASDVSYLEAVKEAVVSDKPEVLVMSAYLYGSEKQGDKYINAIFAARDNGARVIFLAGSMEKDDPILFEIARLGVYDIVFNPCFLEKIMRHIKNPADFKEVSFYFKDHGSRQKRDLSKPLQPSLFLRRTEVTKPDGNTTHGNKGLISKLRARITGSPDRVDGKTNESLSPDSLSTGERDSGIKDVECPLGNSEAGSKDMVEELNIQSDGELFCSANSAPGEEVSLAAKGGDKKRNVFVDGKKRLLKDRTQYYQPSLLEERIEECSSPGSGVRIKNNGSNHKATGKSIVVACWSPASTGKTFVAVNLAVVAAQKEEGATLVDLDFAERAVYSWLNITEQPESVFKLINGEACASAKFSSLDVYGADPYLDSGVAESFPEPEMGELLNRLEKRSFVVLDMPRELAAWHRELMNKCSSVVVVADPDCHNYLKLHRYAGELEGCILVVNKDTALEGPLDFRNSLGVDPAVRIPLSGRVYNSILIGKPLVLMDRDVYALFDLLYQKVRQRGKYVLVSGGVEQGT